MRQILCSRLCILIHLLFTTATYFVIIIIIVPSSRTSKSIHSETLKKIKARSQCHIVFFNPRETGAATHWIKSLLDYKSMLVVYMWKTRIYCRCQQPHDHFPVQPATYSPYPPPPREISHSLQNRNGVCIGAYYRLDDTGIGFWWGRNFPPLSDRSLGSSSLLYYGYRVIPADIATEAWL
jgi:hypothetical protein